VAFGGPTSAAFAVAVRVELPYFVGVAVLDCSRVLQPRDEQMDLAVGVQRDEVVRRVVAREVVLAAVLAVGVEEIAVRANGLEVRVQFRIGRRHDRRFRTRIQ